MSADASAWIDVLSPSVGYSSTSVVLSALTSDGSGGTLLPLAGGGSIDIADVAPSRLGAANFRIG